MIENENENKEKKVDKVNSNEKTFRMDGKMVLILIVCALIVSMLAGKFSDWLRKQGPFFSLPETTEPVITNTISDDENEDENEDDNFKYMVD